VKIGDLVRTAQGFPDIGSFGIITEIDPYCRTFVRVYWLKDQAYEWIQRPHIEVHSE
jgi:hypothetical protein